MQLVSLARVVLASTLVAALAACAAPGSSDPAAAEQQQVAAAPAVVISIGEGSRLSIPAFEGDAARYHRLTLTSGSLVELRNDSAEPRTVVVGFDGPPMLDPAHEEHTTTTLTLAPGVAQRWTVSPTSGVYDLRCPEEDGRFFTCPGITLDPAAANPDWLPRIHVSMSF